MFVTPSAMNHLRKYFDLARSHYQECDLGLAIFFAITLIEECAKILYLRDADVKHIEQRQGALSHRQKHLTALINLLSASDRFDALPKEWQELAWSWFSGRQLMQLRNRSLYIGFNTRKQLTVPDQNISPKDAALLVYISGFTAAELSEYVDLEPDFIRYMLQGIETFHEQHLSSLG